MGSPHRKPTYSKHSVFQIFQTILGYIHTMPDKFVSATLFIRICLPSTLVLSKTKQFFRKLFRFRYISVYFMYIRYLRGGGGWAILPLHNCFFFVFVFRFNSLARMFLEGYCPTPLKYLMVLPNHLV